MLTECPECGYSLKGLPSDHNCPECGLHYNASSRVFKADGRATRLINATKLLSFFCFGLLSLHGALNNSGKRKLFDCLVFLGNGILIVFIIYEMVQFHRLGRLIAVLPEHLFIRLNRVVPEKLEWSKIEKISLSQLPPRVKLMIRNRRACLDLAGVFQSFEEARQFAELVHMRVGPSVEFVEKD